MLLAVESILTHTDIRDETKIPSFQDFPGGPVVNNLPSNPGDTGSIPGWGTKIPHATGQLSPHALEATNHN